MACPPATRLGSAPDGGLRAGIPGGRRRRARILDALGSVGDHDADQTPPCEAPLASRSFSKQADRARSPSTQGSKRAFTPEDMRSLISWARRPDRDHQLSLVRRGARRAEDLHRHLLDALGDGVLIGWPNGRYEAIARGKSSASVNRHARRASLRGRRKDVGPASDPSRRISAGI